MESGQVICPRRRTTPSRYREFASKGAHSVIFMVLAMLALRPLLVDQMISRADAYSTYGMFQDSKRQCNKALLLDGDNSEAWCRLARIHKTQGEREIAYSAYLRATQTDAANKPAYYDLGMMYVQDELYQQAIPYLDQVRKLGPDEPRRLRRGGFPYHKTALDVLALCYEKADDIAKAEFTLEEIRVFYPDYAKTDTRLAELKKRHEK